MLILPIRTLLNKNHSQINVVGCTLALTSGAALYSFFKPRIGAEHMKTSKSIPAGIAAFLVCGSWLSEDADRYGGVASVGSRNGDNPAHAGAIDSWPVSGRRAAAMPLLPFRL